MVGFRAIAAAALLMPLLSGCALFHPSHRANIAIRVPDQPSVEEYGAQQMALGRKMLDEDNYGQAIIAFRNVQHITEQAAAAHNGMGIAYSQLGRPDLAERYFKLALIEAPGERRYQANLDRFYQSAPALAKVDRSEALASAEAASLPPLRLVNAAGDALIRVELPAARTVRVSSNEVLIETGPVEVRRRAPRSQMARATAANGEPRRNPAYPVRISIGRGQ